MHNLIPVFFNLRANFRLYELLPHANRSLFPSGSNGKLIFVLRVFALRAVLEERIKLVNRGITVLDLQLYIFANNKGQVQGGQQTDFLSYPPPFYQKTEAESSFRNFVVLQFYNLDDGQSPKAQFYIL
jgi:hypothetical protein